MNDRAFEATRALLQINFNPADYQSIVGQYKHAGIFSPYNAGADYWTQMPSYTVSRCPLCGAEYTAQLDTYSLEGGWSTHTGSWNTVGYEGHRAILCTHVVAAQKIVNLNGIVPQDLDYYRSELDVPFVMPPFVAEQRAAAVIHSLPICRIELETFVPRYSAFFLVYYADDPAAIRTQRATKNLADGANDPEYYPSATFTNSEASAYADAYDLNVWVARQKVYWLDPTTPDLVLQTGQSERFPYADIAGYRRPYTIRNGKLTLGL